MEPYKEGAETHGDVHGDDDEPDEPLDLAFGESKEGESKARLGPDGGCQRERSSSVDELYHDDGHFDVCRPVIPVFPVANGGRIRETGRFRGDAYLLKKKPCC